MKYYRHFFSQLKIYVTTPMSYTYKFSSYVTMISYFFIVIINEFFTNPVSITRLELFFFFLIHDQIFFEVFFFITYYFFTAFKLFKNHFNKLISCILASKNNNRFTKFIINTNKFVSKTTRNVILIFFWITTIITFNTF